MLKINPQYLVDDNGEKTAALLTIKEFQLLMQYLKVIENILEMDVVAETDTEVNQSELMEYAETQLRKLCDSRKLNWDEMNETDREKFVNYLIHEDRECVQ